MRIPGALAGGLTEVNAQSGRWLQVGRRESSGSGLRGDADFAESEVEHPLIRTHEETGHKASIAVSGKHQGLEPRGEPGDISFFDQTFDPEQFVTRFKWQAGSLAMWDNRCMFLNALNDYQGHRRHMHESYKRRKAAVKK